MYLENAVAMPYYLGMVEGSKRWAAATAAFVVLIVVGAAALVLEHALLGYIIGVVGCGGLATLWSLNAEDTKRGLLVTLSVAMWLVTGFGFWRRRP
jgi:hypothetical protein